MIYVQKRRSDTWHHAGNCHNLPHHWFRMRDLPDRERPSTGECCDQCLAKEKHGTLKPIHEGGLDLWKDPKAA